MAKKRKRKKKRCPMCGEAFSGMRRRTRFYRVIDGTCYSRQMCSTECLVEYQARYDQLKTLAEVEL